jgi:hypothetical protein
MAFLLGTVINLNCSSFEGLLKYINGVLSSHISFEPIDIL